MCVCDKEKQTELENRLAIRQSLLPHENSPSHASKPCHPSPHCEGHPDRKIKVLYASSTRPLLFPLQKLKRTVA